MTAMLHYWHSRSLAFRVEQLQSCATSQQRLKGLGTHISSAGPVGTHISCDIDIDIDIGIDIDIVIYRHSVSERQIMSYMTTGGDPNSYSMSHVPHMLMSLVPLLVGSSVRLVSLPDCQPTRQVSLTDCQPPRQVSLPDCQPPRQVSLPDCQLPNMSASLIGVGRAPSPGPVPTKHDFGKHETTPNVTANFKNAEHTTVFASLGHEFSGHANQISGHAHPNEWSHTTQLVVTHDPISGHTRPKISGHTRPN